jgi:hypothetical protein
VCVCVCVCVCVLCIWLLRARQYVLERGRGLNACEQNRKRFVADRRVPEPASSVSCRLRLRRQMDPASLSLLWGAWEKTAI